MALDLERLKEIAGASFAALRRRPRVAFLVACLLVLAGSWWGTMFFADRLLSTLPDRSGPSGPLPLSQAEIEEQIRQAQELNERLRAQRAERAFAMEQARGPAADTTGDASSPGYGGVPVLPPAAGRRVPAPTDFVPTDHPAEPVYTVKPRYPDLARQAGAEGTVVVQALVGADGRVHDARVLRSIPMLDGAAQDAVRQWRFRPAEADGAPVATWVSVPITFRR